jgi:hypothetical protein
MDASPTAAIASADQYRLPELLRDIRLLDLLELSGTTVETGRWLRISQPTISRRYRSMADDFGLVRDRQERWGCAFGTSPTMRMLRLGSRLHRLAAGVARIGSDWLHQPLLARCPWLLPTPQRFRPLDNWLELVRQGVLDGALISGLDLLMVDGGNRQELELVPVGDFPLALAFDPRLAALETGAAGVEVLVPERWVAPGLHAALRERGLTLRNGENSWQCASAWAERIHRSAQALVVGDVEAEGWAMLRRCPLPEPLRSPLWLALPEDWRNHAALRHTLRMVRQRGRRESATGTQNPPPHS